MQGRTCLILNTYLMKILESFMQGKLDSVALCEDGLVTTEHFAAVIDGSTSKRATSMANPLKAKKATEAAVQKSGGRQAMERISRAIGTLPEDATMESAARCFTQVLRNDMPEAALTCAALRPTCSAVVYSRKRREVWLFGDCQCRFEGKTYDNPKHVDEILTRARCEAVAYLLSKGASADSIRHFDAGRAFIYDALRDQTNFQNDPDVRNPYRYTVLDGTEMDLSTVPVLAVPSSVKKLILASDGYPVLRDTWRETEDELQRLLREDPLCIHENAATKCLMEGQVSFDDRTYLALEV